METFLLEVDGVPPRRALSPPAPAAFSSDADAGDEAHRDPYRRSATAPPRAWRASDAGVPSSIAEAPAAEAAARGAGGGAGTAWRGQWEDDSASEERAVAAAASVPAGKAAVLERGAGAGAASGRPLLDTAEQAGAGAASERLRLYTEEQVDSVLRMLATARCAGGALVLGFRV